LGKPKGQSGRFEADKNLLTLATLDPWIVQPVEQSLHRQRYSGKEEVRADFECSFHETETAVQVSSIQALVRH
jgi:hypothetical protein